MTFGLLLNRKNNAELGITAEFRHFMISEILSLVKEDSG